MNKFMPWYRYAKPVWNWLLIGWAGLIGLPLLPEVSLGQGGAILVGTVIIAEMNLSKIRSQFGKIVDLAVARAKDVSVACVFNEDRSLREIGAADIDADAMFKGRVDKSYATISLDNTCVELRTLEKLIKKNELYDAIKLKTSNPLIRPWGYHETLERLNDKVQTVITISAVLGTFIWAFGDQWACC